MKTRIFVHLNYAYFCVQAVFTQGSLIELIRNVHLLKDLITIPE